MIKVAKNLIVFLLISFVSINSFAAQDEDNSNDNIDYYGNEGDLIFKIRASGIKTRGTPKPPPSTIVPNPVAVGSFTEVGYGVEASTSIFFSTNIAAELSLGFDILRIKANHLANVAVNNGGNIKAIGKRKQIYTIPVTLLAQYHIAPFGSISPYVGAGYHGSYMLTKSKAFKMKNAFGPVIQAGIDFYAKDDTLINLDIKQYLFKAKVDYKNALVGPRSVSSKIKLNPLVVSVGVGFKF